MKHRIICTLIFLALCITTKAQIGVFTKVISDSSFSKDYRFRSLPNYSLYNGITNIISPTTGTYDLTTPPGTTAQRPTVPALKYILRYNTDSAALEIGNPSQVWKTLTMSSVQTFDTSSISNFGLKVRSLFSATTPLQYNAVTGNIALPVATSSVAGYLASADWVIFNAKLPDPGSNGILVRTALGTTAARQLVAASTNISLVNATGVSGNPSIDVNDTLVLAQIQLNQIPGVASFADSVVVLNRTTNRIEVRPVAGGGGSGTYNKVGGGISATGDSLYLTTVTANRALISSAGGIPTVSSVTDVELGYLSGVTSAIQTQLNGKQPTGNYITALTSDVTASGPGSVAATIAANAVTDGKFRQSAGNSLVGKATSGTGNVADITATTANTFLGYNGTSLTFGDPLSTISSTYIAYVDSASGNNTTGQVNNIAKPFRTGNGALDATVGLASCIIHFGIGHFDSPDSAKMRSNIWIRGSGMPVANDTMSVNAYYNNTIKTPTKLIGGTIFNNSFMIPFNRENITMTDCGIDVGSDWVTNVNSGVEVDGMLCAQKYSAGGGLPSADGKHELQVNTKPRRNMNWRNISVLLPSPSSPFHAFLVENAENESFDNIYTNGGFAGIVIKTIGGIGRNLHTRNHATYGVILKSNDYSHCYGVVIDGFVCGPSSGNVGIGFDLDQGDAGSPGIYWCNVSNGFINHVGVGMSLTGDNMNISNVTILDVGVAGISSSNLLKSNVTNITQRISPQQGYDIDPGSVIANGGTTWSNCTAFGNAGDGWRVHGGSALNYFENIFSGENTGFGFSTNGSAYVGEHTYYSNTAGATTGTIHNRLEITGLVSAGSGISISGLGTDASPYDISASGGSQTWQQTLTTGSTLTGNNTVTGGNNSLTFNGMFNYRVNANGFILDKTTATAPYTQAVLGTANQLWIGYTPVATVYSKGAGVIIDTNNNVSLGTGIITTAHPLYTYGSAYAQGFTSGKGNFYRVEDMSTDHTMTVEEYWVNIDATGGNVTMTLPAASTAFGSGVGIQYVFRRVDNSGNTVTITRAGSDTINGATTTSLSVQYETKEIQCVSTSTWAIK